MKTHIEAERRAHLRVVAGLALVMLVATGAAAQVLGPPPAAPAPGSVTMVPPISRTDADTALAQVGLTASSPVYAKKKHQEVVATTKEGRPVIVKFDWAGRVHSVTDANHRKFDLPASAILDQAQLSERVRAAGFEPLGIVETKRHHVVMRARNQKAEMFELHIDFAGNIYKQVWLR